MAISLITLFFWSLLAATILPLGVEPYFIYHIMTYDQPLTSVVVASTGNIAGSLTILWLGISGSQYLSNRLSSSNQKLLNVATKYFTKYGLVSLFFSWIPLLGDIFVLMAGLSKPPLTKSIVYISIGKIMRFIFLTWAI